MDGAFAFVAPTFKPLVWRGQAVEAKGVYRIKRFAEDGVCIDELDLKYIATCASKKVRVHVGSIEVLSRRMVLALTPTGRWVYIDRKTGSLYDALSGKCKSSELLRIEPGDL